MIGTPRHFGMSALVLFLIIALWGAIHYVATSPTALPDNQECVLVVGDFGRDNLAKPVLKQIEQQQTITTSGHMRVVGVDTGEYLDQYGRVTDHAGLVWDLMKKASRYRTIAVIDASTTHVSPIVIEAANSLGIPVLVTVATNDGVIAAGSWALRMPANDSAQALAIAKWCRSYGRVALIHDGTQYGAFLHRNVLDHLGDSETLSYVLDGGSSAPLLMRDIVASDSDAIVYMGYGNRLGEILSASRSAKARDGKSGRSAVPILLSDGCYSDDLSARLKPEDNLSLSLPHATVAGGFGPFGRDAYVLINRAQQDPDRTTAGPAVFLDHLARLAKEDRGTLGLTTTYDFRDCENKAARFNIFRITKGGVNDAKR